MKKTKIITTIGPATESKKKISELYKAGMNVVRLNFSHGDHASHRKVIAGVKSLREKGMNIAMMQDLQGPKIRVCAMKESVVVKRGEELVIANSKVKTQNTKIKSISIDIDGLYKYVKPGNKILINDGLIALKVKSSDVKKKQIVCTVTAGGEIQQRKGVNLPGIKLPMSSLTDKDRKDLAFGLKQGVDIVSLSFVRSQEDIKELKKEILKHKAEMPLIIAKIEKPAALKCIDKIIDESDGIMIARGDLAVEVGYIKITEIQKKFIKKANDKGKIVIVATQMLESMINNPFPQRAEITDIYNAVKDGADALMLSGETSVGKYPVKVVKTMSDIAKDAEKKKCSKVYTEIIDTDQTYENLLSYAASLGESMLKRSIIAVYAEDVDDVKYISDYRPCGGVVAFTKDKNLCYKLAMYNGVYPILVKEKSEKSIIGRIRSEMKKVQHVVFIDFHEKNSKGKIVIYKV